MEFTNEFRVSADIDRTFATLTDLEEVAPCMPGATLEEVEGSTYTGRMKVKVGPVQLTYRGTAEVTKIDEGARQAAISASGKETRGSGTAQAEVTASLREEDGQTVVTVVSNVDVTGKPAQFGRGVLADVGEQIIRQFATRLESLLSQDTVQQPEGDQTGGDQTGGDQAGAGTASPQAAGAQATATGEAGERSARRVLAEDPSRADDALDLWQVAGAATVRRVVPLAAGLALLAGLIWWLARR